MLQLDEEVEAMQAIVIEQEQQLQQQQHQHKHSKSSLSREGPITNSTSSSKGAKDRTKGTVNGPIDTASTSVSST